MKFVVALSVSVASLSAAKPYPAKFETNDVALEKRAGIVSVTCPRVAARYGSRVSEAKTYSVKDITDAFTIGTGLLLQPPHFVKGTNKKEYPAKYGNQEKIALPANCNSADTMELKEFPILRGGVPFGEESNPGTDRADRRFTYCYTVYHKDGIADDGGGAGNFAQCT